MRRHFTLSHNPSDARIKNSSLGPILTTWVSGSAITHCLSCLSPIARDTARDPWILQTPLKQSMYPPCKKWIDFAIHQSQWYLHIDTKGLSLQLSYVKHYLSKFKILEVSPQISPYFLVNNAIHPSNCEQAIIDE